MRAIKHKLQIYTPHPNPLTAGEGWGMTTSKGKLFWV